MNNLKPYEFRQTLVEQARAYGISALCVLGLSASLMGIWKTKEPELKILFAGIGLTACVAGRLAGHTSDEQAQIANDYHDVSDAARTTAIALSMAPKMLTGYSAQSTTQKPPLVPFNWLDLKTQRDKYPHLMLLGSTGDGKSVLAENLGALLGGTVIGAIPHWEAGEYESLDLVVGEELNYGVSALPYSDEPEKGKTQNDEPEIVLADILNRKTRPTICQFLRAVYNEMIERFQLDPVTRKRPNREPLTIVLDEYLSYAKVKGVDDIVKRLIREARKVGIRLVLLVQGDNVAGLGWEGEGDLRENLTYVYLKDFAITQAKQLRNAQKDEVMKEFWTEVLARLDADRFPTMVEKYYAERPPMNAFSKTEREPNAAPNYVEPVRYNSMPVPVLPNVQNVQTVNISTPNEQTFDEKFDARKALWNAAREAVERGMKRSEIIKKVWGYKSERYTLGTELWRDLIKEFGDIISEEDKD